MSETRLFRIEQIDLTFSNGAKRIFERIAPTTVMHKAVLIIPMLDEDTVLLVKEYSVGVEQYTLSFPKGTIDQGEKLFEAADRELMEEVGYSAEKYTFLKDVYLSPNYMAHNISIVKAEGLHPKKLPGDEPEPLEVVPYPLSKVDQLIEDASFIECRSFAALLFAWQQWLKKNGLK
ncbi:ADP compounds hydrolase NudE [Facilibium subflavum]|uniref:ADP compounds hydrolase NudE n=1 Tax=Facilibium subflavum TaxID=2219058 RepID=UPI001F1E5589|nr:ADP compounds hydrolase NudE [Facilibium subflavum]